MLGDVTKKRRGAPQDMDSAHAGLANGLHKPKPEFDGGLASQALTATFGSKRQGEAHGAPASEVHSHPDRGREVHAIKIAACQPAGDLRLQEAAISLDALPRPIADHLGERIERTSAARRRKAAIRAWGITPRGKAPAQASRVVRAARSSLRRARSSGQSRPPVGEYATRSSDAPHRA